MITLTTYLTELKVVVDKLAAVGVEMEEEVVTLDLLASLPTAFKTLVTAISAQQEVPALSFVEDKVLEEEERIKEHEDRAAPAGQAFTVGNGFRNNNKSSNGNNNNNNNNSSNNNSNNSNTSIRKCDWSVSSKMRSTTDRKEDSVIKSGTSLARSRAGVGQLWPPLPRNSKRRDVSRSLARRTTGTKYCPRSTYPRLRIASRPFSAPQG
ncbi:unnamed protein product [Tilletia controversa]|nr:unnamed protein product [Tilletia controversa]